MIAEIIAVGNEVVDGSLVNTNASWLAGRLSGLGLVVRWHSAVPDDEALIAEALRRASGRSQWVLVTGGLGPTVDDFTLEVAANFFGKPLMPDPLALKKIRQRFAQLGREITPNQEKQCLFPEGSAVLLNEKGTAAGAYFEHQGVGFAFFPGVPAEMESMFEKNFLPILTKRLGNVPRRYLKVLRCFGLTEGQMDQKLQGDLKGRLDFYGTQLGFRLRFPTIDIRLSYESGDPEKAQAVLEQAARAVRAKLGDFVFGEGDLELEEVVGNLLSEKKLTLATAESCTGGLMAHRITQVPGASNYFVEGMVTYANEAKMKELGVPEEILKASGAVSAETALAMARGIRRRSGSDFGIALTGIAGPAGGTAEKPVGTVHIAVAHPGGEWERRYYFPFGRRRFKQLAVAAALDRLRRILLQ